MDKVISNLNSRKTVIILGASGLIGTTVSKYLSDKTNVFRVFRGEKENLKKQDIFVKKINFQTLELLTQQYKPNFIINCIGLTKHLANRESNKYFYPNVFIPRYLKILSDKFDFNLLHISSDCVFSGREGNYKETSLPDAMDYYGLTKAISETDLETIAMVLRTSTVGHEQHTQHGLVEWFLSSEKNIKGFSRALFNGVTTLELAEVVWEIISGKIKFQNGIFHVTSNTISKYDFLSLINEIYEAKKNISKDERFIIDRTLHKSDKIKALDRSKKSWRKMILKMKENRNNEFLK